LGTISKYYKYLTLRLKQAEFFLSYQNFGDCFSFSKNSQIYTRKIKISQLLCRKIEKFRQEKKNTEIKVSESEPNIFWGLIWPIQGSLQKVKVGRFGQIWLQAKHEN